MKNSTLQSCINYFRDKDEIALDTETEGFFPHKDKLLLLQLGDQEISYVIDCTSVDISPLKQMLETKLLVIHNAKFDLRFLYKKGIIPFGNVYCTFLAHKVAHLGIDQTRSSLFHLVYENFGVKLNKEVRGRIHKAGVSDLEVIHYAAADVEYLLPLKKILHEDVVKKNLERVLELENLFVSVIAYIEYCGFKLDQDKWKQKMQDDQIDLMNAFTKLERIGVSMGVSNNGQISLFDDTGINWDSPQQVISVFRSLGLDLTAVDKKTGKKKESVEEAVIIKYKSNELVKAYLEYKKASKRCTTYGKVFLDNANMFPDGRVRSNFTQMMKTGRMSSGGEDTPNQQNIPKRGKERGCFIPEDGNIFVISDYSQQEQVIMANTSKDEALLEFFRGESSDMHSYIVRKIYPELENLTDDEIKDLHSEERDAAKKAGFSINFGGVGATIARNMDISKEEGDLIYKNYMEAFPGLDRLFKANEAFAYQHGYLIANPISGRKRFLPEVFRLKHQWNTIDWDRYREDEEYKFQMKKVFKGKARVRTICCNYRIQATAADVTKLAGINLFKWILDNKLFDVVKIPLILHDELITESPVNLAKTVKFNLQESMDRASRTFCDEIQVKNKPIITPIWTH